MKNITTNVRLEVLINNAVSANADEKFLIVNIPIEKLQRASNQRIKLNQTNVNKIAKNWNWHQYDPLKVTYHYNDDYVEVQDGWHRVNAAILANKEYGQEITSLPCRVYINLKREEELDIFLKQQDNVTRLRIVDKFPSMIEKGNKTVIQFIDICKKYNIIICGYEFPDMKTHRKIGSIAKSLKIIEDYSPDCFEWIINLIFAAKWENKQGAFQGCLLLSLASFYNEKCRKIVGEQLVEILKEVKNTRTLNQLAGCTTQGNEACYNDFFLKKLNGDI